MVGAPVAGLLGVGAAATASVAALVSDSALPASSVKLTCTLMALPSSAIGQGVGQGVGRSRYVGVVGQPLVAEGGICKTVLIGDARRVPHFPASHLPGRLPLIVGTPVAGLLGSGRCRHRSPWPRWSVTPRLPVIVGEAHLNLNGLTLVAIGQGVCGACCPADVHVVSQPLVSEGSVREPVGVGDPRCVRLPASLPPARCR